MVRGLRPYVEGKTLLSVEVPDVKLAHVAPALALPAPVGSLARRGKFLLFHLGDRMLVLHPRMSGRVVWDKGEPARRRLSLRFPQGAVHLVDPRRLSTAEVVAAFDDHLGPEPLAGLSWLPAALRGSRMPIKLWLMDQKKIAGIGNIYASEILFRAGVDPRRPAGSLSRLETKRLKATIPAVLAEAIAACGTTLGDRAYRGPHGEIGEFRFNLAVYGREADPCPRCAEDVRRIVLGGRGTYFCPRCQT